MTDSQFFISSKGHQVPHLECFQTQSPEEFDHYFQQSEQPWNAKLVMEMLQDFWHRHHLEEEVGPLPQLFPAGTDCVE